MVMGRNGHGPIWLWAEMTRNRLSQPCGEDFREGVGYPGKESINCIGAAWMTFLSLLLVSACTTLCGPRGRVDKAANP